MLTLSVVAAADDIKVSDVEALYGDNSYSKSEKGLKQSINLGFASTRGNTDTLNLNGKYEMSFQTLGYENRALLVHFNASAFVTENNDVKDNEEYTVNLGLEQHIGTDWSGYTSFRWLQNEFQNYDNKFALGAGVGKTFYDDGKHLFKAKLGIAYNVEEYSNTQEDHSYTSLTQYIGYTNKLNKLSDLYLKVGFSENIEDFGDYEMLAVAGLNFEVAENFSVTLEGEIRYDKVPPIGFDTTDTKTIIRLGYSF